MFHTWINNYERVEKLKKTPEDLRTYDMTYKEEICFLESDDNNQYSTGIDSNSDEQNNTADEEDEEQENSNNSPPIMKMSSKKRISSIKTKASNTRKYRNHNNSNKDSNTNAKSGENDNDEVYGNFDDDGNNGDTEFDDITVDSNGYVIKEKNRSFKYKKHLKSIKNKLKRQFNNIFSDDENIEKEYPKNKKRKLGKKKQEKNQTDSDESDIAQILKLVK